MKENEVTVCIAPSEMRLIKDSIPELVDRSQKLWIYQVRYNPESEWIPMYSFSEVEFLPQDFGVMNFATSKNPTSWFTQAFVCTKVILSEDGLEPRGIYVMSGKEVKKRLGKETQVVATLANENDRRQALDGWRWRGVGSSADLNCPTGWRPGVASAVRSMRLADLSRCIVGDVGAWCFQMCWRSRRTQCAADRPLSDREYK